MIKVGIIGFDSSHAVEFTKRLNHVDISEEHWVYGAKVIMGYPGRPSSFADSGTITQRIQLLKEFGVEIVDSAEEMIGKVDAIMLEQQEGGLHLEVAKPFIEEGIPLFIDKPFTCSVADAKKIFELAHSYDTPVFSSSSLRYALEVQDLKSRGDLGEVLGAETYSPAILHPRNPGLFNYGIHGVEMLYAIMGIGCESVRCFHKGQWDVAIGIWCDERIGVFRGMRRGPHNYGFTAFCEKAIVSSSIDTRYIYRELLKKVVEMFQNRRMPINPEETIEIIAFLEASLKSAIENSKEVCLSELIDHVRV
ncbi:MAG: Gfo/Idh/MocA family oxidoreductase [Candidatus Bathyarchaeia archaeon]